MNNAVYYNAEIILLVLKKEQSQINKCENEFLQKQ